jgi:hypothetical protein
MPYSYAVYTGNGATTQFTVPFPYIRREHVVASLDYVSAVFTWVNNTTVQISPAPANGVRVEIRRVTPVNNPLVDFTDGSTLVAADLDTNALQQTYINQEQDDQIQQGIYVDANGNLTAGNQVLKDLLDPVAAQDAATKNYVDTQDALKVSKTGDTMTGALAMSGQKITGLGNPTNAQDAATKTWVETATTSPLVQFRSIFYGAYATDPAVDPYGAARTEGDLYFNTTLDQMRVFNGTSWQEASADATITRFKFTAAGGETSLSGNDDNAQSLTYNVGLEMVYLNGALLTRGVDYVATTDSSITGLAALSAADLVEVVAFSQIDAIGSIPSANSTFLQSGAGAVQRTVDNKLKDVVSVKDFGAVGDGVADDTAAIQAALNFAGNNLLAIRRVTFPTGAYLTDTLYVPVGIAIEGETFSETTARTGSKLIQRSVGDVLRFTPQNTGGKLYWFGAIRRLAIFGDTSLASGWGIAFRDSANATVSMQDLSCLEDLVVRGCPSGGIEIPNSGLPITLQRIKLLFNNGPGIHMTSVTTHQHQGVNFTDISGDGNNGGLIKLSGLDRSGNVNIFNLKSETRINSSYGSVKRQENAIVLNGCDGTPINVFGVTHICSAPDGANFEKPGSVIKLLDGSFPEINWSGVSVRVRAGDTGPDPSIIEYSTTIAVPYTTTSGRFGNFDFSHVTQASTSKQTFGTVSSYQAASVENTAFQIAGTTPGLSLYETDAGANSKAWLWVASGGSATLRAINDNGSLGQIIFTATRTRLDVGPNSSGTYLRINGTNQTSGVGGAATALPSNPVGYITVNINGTDRRIPYYGT